MTTTTRDPNEIRSDIATAQAAGEWHRLTALTAEFRAAMEAKAEQAHTHCGPGFAKGIRAAMKREIATFTQDCPLCGADGAVPVRLERSPDNWPVGVYAECPLCRGKGQVTPEQADDYRHETEGGIR